MNPNLSVIVPVYKVEPYIRQCLDSLVNQTYQDMEIIVIDDGSPDNCGAICDEYAAKYPQMRVIHKRNAGLSAARNQGIEMARGKWIAFVDSDDWCETDYYEKLLHAYDNNTSLSVCGVHYKRLRTKTAEDVYIKPLRSRKKNETKKTYILYLLAIDGRMYSSVNKLYQAKFAKECHFDESLNFAEDTKFVLDYLNLADGEPRFVLEALYIYNFGTETSTIRSAATKWENWQRQYQDLKTWLGPRPTMIEKFWLHTVRARWRVSYIRSKRRAKQ